MEALINDGRRIDATARSPNLLSIDPMVRMVRSGSDTAHGQPPFWRAIRVLRRRKRLIVGMVVLGAVIAAIAGIMLRPSYTAMAQIIVEQRPVEAVGGTAAVSSSVEEAVIDTHVTVLFSEALLRRVASELLAAQEIATAPTTGRAEPSSWVQPIRSALGRVWSALSHPFRAADQDASSDAAQRSLVAELKRNLRVSQERRSRIITVFYLANDPDRAAAIANMVVQVYLQDLFLQKRAEAERLVDWLTKRTPEMRHEVARAEQDLEAYRLVQGAAIGSNSDETGQQIAQLTRQLAVTRSDAAAVQERLSRIRQLRERAEPTAALADAIGSAQLAELARREFNLSGSGQVPQPQQRRDLDAAIRQEIDRSVGRLDAEARIYQAQARSIEERLQPLKEAATETATGLSGLRALERQATAGVQLYDAMLRRQQEAQEKVQLVQPDARLLAPAWPPERPSSLHAAFLIPPAVIAFGIMGVLVVFGLDRLNRTIRDNDEAAEVLGVPCLASMPMVAQWEETRIQDLLLYQPQAAYSRAVRALLVSLLGPNLKSSATKVVLVTSALPGEGKTALACSLAILAARVRLRVLLMNLDEQTSALEREIRLPGGPAGPGADLAELLEGARSLSDAVERIAELQFDYISTPRFGGSLFRLLASRKIPPWLNQFRDAYDLIVVDAPSVSDRPEISLLAGAADKVLFTVRCGTTCRETAQNALRLVRDAAGFDPPSAPRVASVLTWADRDGAVTREPPFLRRMIKRTWTRLRYFA